MATEPDNASGPARQDGFRPAYRRSHTTRRSVLMADAAAGVIIRIGGLLVIVAVFGIMVFLAQVVVPLFSGAGLDSRTDHRLPPVEAIRFIRTDEYKTMLVRLSGAGVVETFHIASGKPLSAQTLDLGERRITSLAHTLDRDTVVLGLDDGSIAILQVSLRAEIMTPENLPHGLEFLSADALSDGVSAFSKIVGGQYRRITPVIALEAPTPVSGTGAPILAVDIRVSESAERPTRSIVTVDAANAVRVSRAETKVNLFTGQAETEVATKALPPLPQDAAPVAVLMTSQGDQVYVFERKGLVHRFDTRDPDAPVLAETANLAADGTEITAAAFLIGEATLVIGFSDGAVHNYFRLQRQGARTRDGYALVRARMLEPHEAAVRDISISQRGKGFATFDAGGAVWFRFATSELTLLKLTTLAGDAPARVLLAPRGDGIVLTGPSGETSVWHVSAPHPETTLRSIFGKVWYEGYEGPSLTWQSSSGTDTFEPKFSLVPLIFGTIKATLYALLFALPVALGAAIYTSEFLHRRVRAKVKPVMEMMESLPTVVLGFVAALILAPFVENWIAAVLLAFLVLPLSFAAAAYAWQLLPGGIRLRLEGNPKFLLMGVVVLASSWAAWRAGPAFERLFFAGDLKAWVNGGAGTGTAFTGLVLFPLCILLVSILVGRVAGERLRRIRRAGSSGGSVISALRWGGTVAASAALAWGLAAALTGLGFDPRGGIVDTYVQRNALVVGFVMGFSVIPNIYTLAEDALNAVPAHLRAGSLASGATPWQTAIQVVLPTALSGVFAAVMIGMGRAVGETMIVVMAAGNTPVLDWNIFNGLRTLSANIAVELPEAVVDGTLYRTLFLAALTLFLMTFVINTIAEIVRQRFRKRAFQL